MFMLLVVICESCFLNNFEVRCVLRGRTAISTFPITEGGIANEPWGQVLHARAGADREPGDGVRAYVAPPGPRVPWPVTHLAFGLGRPGLVCSAWVNLIQKSVICSGAHMHAFFPTHLFNIHFQSSSHRGAPTRRARV